ncbi:hypothetical protein [Mucilaginibacter ginsenosidivorax]|uniref:Uncharacterized protein n=1 Tax=Mucilaginibacter ginsenosidivorax TaxID=862126 RepID=A0A5B8W606_9SPHI|nr:hypothetical protein [Mucilaginibacter ginsenosidivorax]QEC78355.1 hypothetical protein FSB76_21305 [Mucilaginibacter ginsenosidivorax]
MAIIFPTPPNFDAKSFVESVHSQIKINKDFNKYAVGVTDVVEKYIDWKYTRQYKFKQYYSTFNSIDNAEQVYREFLTYGYQDLEFDSVDINDTANCKSVFIIHVPNS